MQPSMEACAVRLDTSGTRPFVEAVLVRTPDAAMRTSIWKPQKVYNDGIYLVYTRHMTTYSIYQVYTKCRFLVYTWYIPVI